MFQENGKRSLRLLWFLVLMLLCFLRTAACEERKLTVMVYMCGSNLESQYGSASADLQEMTAAGVNGNAVSLLVMTGGSSRWESGYSAEETVITEISSRGRRIVSSRTQSNMGQKETLTGFLRFSCENYPAEQYALIFWDHGGGPLEGVCWDEVHNSDHLTLAELTRALEESPFGGRNAKLSWIGFDACLMSTLEVASRLAPYAEYMIASQAEEPASGWNYSFLRGIEDDVDGAETGRRIVDAYFDALQGERRDLTLACVGLSEIKTVEEKVNTLFAGIAKTLNAETFSDLAKLRLPAVGFGKSKAPEQGTNGYDLVDLASLTNCYESIDREAAGQIRASIEKAVVYSKTNLEESCGLSVYHPFRNRQKFLEGWNREYLTLSQCPGYASYVDAYGQIMTGEPLVRWNDLYRYSGVLPAENGVKVFCSLSRKQAENMAKARLIVLAKNGIDAADQSFCRVYTSDNVYFSDFSDDYIPSEEGEILLAADYHLEVLQEIDPGLLIPKSGAISFRISDDGTYLVDLYPYGPDGRRPEKPIIAEYIRNTEYGELILKSYAVYDEMTGTYSQRADVDLSKYQGVTFLKEYRNPAENAIGEMLPFDSWPEDRHLDTHMDTSFSEENEFGLAFSSGVFSDELFAGFEITDTQGNVYMTPITPVYNVERTHYPAQAYLTEIAGEMNADVMITPEEAVVFISMINTHDAPVRFLLKSAEINGIPIPENRNLQLLSHFETDELGGVFEPGEGGMTMFRISQKDLRENNPDAILKTFGGIVEILPENADQEMSVYSFAGEPMISLDLPDNETKTYEGIDIFHPSAGDGKMFMNHYITVHWGQYEGTNALRVNLELTNGSKKNLLFGMILNSINGVPLETARIQWGMNGNGETAENRVNGNTWDSLSGNRISLAPGETSMASLNITQDDIKRIAPDTALRECEYTLYVLEVSEDGRDRYLNCFPVLLKMDVPLEAFYPESILLPSREPEAESRREMEARQKTFAEYEELKLSLQRIYFSDWQALLLIRAENTGKEKRTWIMDHARVGNRQAFIGTAYADHTFIRNRQIVMLGLDKEAEELTYCLREELEAGENRYYYVSLYLPRQEPFEADDFTFDILYLGNEGAKGTCSVKLTLDGIPDPYMDGWSWISPEKILIQADGLVPMVNSLNFLENPVPDLAPETMKWADFLIQPEEGATVRNAHFALYRKVSSRKELAEMNIILSERNRKEQETLFPIAYGAMDVGEDGKTAHVHMPMIQMAVRSGKEYLTVPTVFEDRAENGTIRLGTRMDDMTFYCRDDSLRQGLMGFTAEFDPADGKTILMKNKASEVIGIDWATMIKQETFFVPADAGENQILSFMKTYFREKISGQSMMQILPLEDHRIEVMIHPLEAPEKYGVLFFWEDEQGKTHFDRKPLTDFLTAETE